MTTEDPRGFRFRDTTRAPFQATVRLRFDRHEGGETAQSADLSMEGMFVVTAEPKAVGTLVQFELDAEGLDDPIQGLGDVVWVRSGDLVTESKPMGMGIQFRYVDPRSRDQIFRIVSEYLQKDGAEALGNRPSSPTDPSSVQASGTGQAAAPPMAREQREPEAGARGLPHYRADVPPQPLPSLTQALSGSPVPAEPPVALPDSDLVPDPGRTMDQELEPFRLDDEGLAADTQVEPPDPLSSLSTGDLTSDHAAGDLVAPAVPLPSELGRLDSGGDPQIGGLGALDAEPRSAGEGIVPGDGSGSLAPASPAVAREATGSSTSFEPSGVPEATVAAGSSLFDTLGTAETLPGEPRSSAASVGAPSPEPSPAPQEATPIGHGLADLPGAVEPGLVPAEPPAGTPPASPLSGLERLDVADHETGRTATTWGSSPALADAGTVDPGSDAAAAPLSLSDLQSKSDGASQLEVPAEAPPPSVEMPSPDQLRSDFDDAEFSTPPVGTRRRALLPSLLLVTVAGAGLFLTRGSWLPMVTGSGASPAEIASTTVTDSGAGTSQVAPDAAGSAEDGTTVLEGTEQMAEEALRDDESPVAGGSGAPADEGRADVAESPALAETAPPGSDDDSSAPRSGAVAIQGLDVRESTGATTLRVVGSPAFVTSQVEALRLQNPPRFVVKVRGVGRSFRTGARGQRVAGIRSGLHPGPELHLVLDLPREELEATADVVDGTLLIRIEDL